MNKILLLIIIFIGFNSIHSQTWRQYNLQTGQITNISYSLSSTGNSDLKNGSRGILPDNFSFDTSRGFFPLDIINDANAYPWRTTVKFNDVTGILIDPYHVLTAGHAIEFNPYFQNVKFIPGYENGEEPFGYAYAEYFYLPSDFSPGTSRDYAIIKLDRPIGALSGWNGYGYNNDDSYFLNNLFNNASFPSQTPYTGEYLFNWKGYFNSVGTDYLLSTRIGAGGMSGSPAFATVNNDKIVYGIVTNLGIKFNRITSSKYDAINAIISRNTPAEFDLIPMNVKVSPQLMKTGNAFESLSFILHNYSSENKSNANITVNLYLSTDPVITPSDDLIATYNYQKSFASKSSELIVQLNSLPAINKPVGDYYVGIIISGDNNANNNTVSASDAASITVTNNNYVTIKGRIVSASANSGVNGVNLNGFPYQVKTDFNGYYEIQVSYGWNGTVTPVKQGYDFTNISQSYSNVTQNTTTNYSAIKKIFVFSGYIKSPNAQAPVSNVKLSGLVNEPYSDANGFFSVSLFYGWSGNLFPVKGTNWNFEPYSNTTTTLTSDKSAYFKSGFYVSGRCFENTGEPITDVILNGFPHSVQSDNNGEYNVFVDSGWTGTVVPAKNNISFSPSVRNYENTIASIDMQDYVEQSAVVLNLKVLLAGAMYENSDTMKTVLNYKNYLPLVPPDTLSGNVTPFVYIKKPTESVTSKFFQYHRNIVDWVIIELRQYKNITTSVDTIVAFIRNDGKVISITGDTLITLDKNIPADSYFVVIRHRNHLAVMSSSPIYLNSKTELYDFSTDSYQFFGGDASLLQNGKYAMYPGDADFNGIINLIDYHIFQSNSILASTGYIYSDFNLDGIVTGSDFNIFAPVNKKRTTTNVQNSSLKKFLNALK